MTTVLVAIAFTVASLSAYVFGIGLVANNRKAYIPSIICYFASALFMLTSVANMESMLPVATDFDTFYYAPSLIEYQDCNTNTTGFITDTGHIYEIETNPEWIMDAVYLLTMDNNATPDDVTDDSICVVWKEVNPVW